jgi:nucleoside-diphosphate-sugar epimerase
VSALRARGDEVVSFSRARYPTLEAQGATCAQGDLSDRSALVQAARGADVVFHTAAKAGIWGDAGEYWRVNVEGSRNVVAACLTARVKRLVFTSSPSVCFDGKDHVMAGNDLPHARNFLAAYPRTKAQAERIVLGQNGSDGLATCALRPHLIVGPDDPHLLPRLAARARAGKLANAVDAHLASADRLEPRAPHAGKAYFIAQRDPVVLWEWIGAILDRMGIPRPKRRVPFALAYSAGALLELAWRARGRESEPPMTRFLALELARSHSYDQGPAERDFGYRERVPMATVADRLIDPSPVP